MDALAQFKESQKQAWSHFAPLEVLTTPQAPRLLAHARVRSGQTLLDVGCGTGVVAITAARMGIAVQGVDLTPALLERARENARTAGVDIPFQQGDVEELPFPDGSFDVVVSQFGHMFAPRPEVAIGQMLRVLKPGGTIAFATWPPELLVGQLMMLQMQYAPPPPPGVALPYTWGDPAIIRERLGNAVKDVLFDRGTMHVPALSPAHQRLFMEQHAGPMHKLVESLAVSDPARLAQFRSDYESLLAPYLKDNLLHQGYLLTRATKR